ncbi:hypothetical protein SCOCK_230089 [Actinacidiphila cocklensis]|uniref:Uncharacterized protein n=1 Tax=Actinacidiphila cocklensis TaxID=887465 RepID=A0A9W4DPM6_9ACTN|nr:hypothetical protein SCOCK_230089 [Actinacidiphila cocklensis]
MRAFRKGHPAAPLGVPPGEAGGYGTARPGTVAGAAARGAPRCGRHGATPRRTGERQLHGASRLAPWPYCSSISSGVHAQPTPPTRP